MQTVGVCGEELPVVGLVVYEVVHPIRWHCTPSDRVHRDVTGVARRNGCTAT